MRSCLLSGGLIERLECRLIGTEPRSFVGDGSPVAAVLRWCWGLFFRSSEMAVRVRRCCGGVGVVVGWGLFSCGSPDGAAVGLAGRDGVHFVLH